MANSQPLNANISIYRAVRSQRDIPLHRSTWEASIGVGVNPQVMVQPGEEVAVTETRGDAGTGDIPAITDTILYHLSRALVASLKATMQSHIY